ncbi:MAG: GGDEF domain-containing protein [Proteobacteria bacterium]|uniref:GGDEF domain-containing protein n=1 Tax=Candidatus Avisuccinivibrio stercorigallinarum TaxID=2840704 RepID=A0A9D9DBA5_9GAMM|nr:GGDEF domain-containing protein [Candidatus Avisuccinivibrio stercorigallinarum]
MKKYISEQDIQRSLRLTYLFALLGTLILGIFVYTVIGSVHLVFDASYKAQLSAYAGEYVTAVRRQVQGDVNALRTLSQFIVDDLSLTDRHVRRSQTQNQFSQIVYLDTGGSMAYASMDGRHGYSHFNNMPVELQQAVITAWRGKDCISQPYHSELNGQPSLGYAVPIVNEKGETSAALLAIKNLAAYEQIIDQLQLKIDGVHLFLVNQEGRILGSNFNRFDLQQLDFIQDIPGLSAAQRTQINHILTAGLSQSLNFNFREIMCTLTFMPVGTEGWSCAYVDYADLTAAPIYQSLSRLVYILLAILVLLVISGGITFFMVRRGYMLQLASAYYDPVTDTYNKARFEQELQERIHHSRALRLSLVSFKIRDFNTISENVGRQMSNELQRLVCASMQHKPSCLLCCRAYDGQFLALLSLSDEKQVRMMLLSVFNEISAQFGRKFTLFPILFYAGIVRCSRSETVEMAINRADFVRRTQLLTYQHDIGFYDDKVFQHELHLKQIEKAMHPALKDGEFKLFLQPKFDLKQGRVTAAEALVRWVRADGTMVYPNDFIPLFERNGFCAELDLYMLEQVCRQIRAWIDAGCRPAGISVNQSRMLIFKADYIDKVQELLQQYRIPPHYITIEILESLMAQDISALSSYISRLRSIGLSISMDDFGAGYSSLNMLSAIEIDEIKFDKEFLLENSPEKKAKNLLILRYLLQLAHKFEAKTVVEGVEQQEDVDFLKALGCDLAQGYYFNKPVDQKTFTELYIQTAA